ncbi:Clp protease ClpP [Limibacterium fermenti]|uniref:Clp protease ClpP n=1 Tax=Limibacterium fermenti TaxID=3229863 RepID=UPI003A6B7768
MRIRKIDNSHAEVKLYGNIGTWFTDGDQFSQMLEEVEANGYTRLTIREHCFGGSVFEGNVIYNALQRSKLDITIVIDGVAASMGCYILPAIENVEICENAFGMVHRPKSFGGGDADAHRNEAKLLDSMEANFIKRVSERTGMKETDVRKKWLDGGDHWLNAKEMVQYGFAKKVIPATAKNIKDLDKDIAANISVESIYDRFAAQLQIESTNHKNDKKMNVSALIAAFALEGVTAESSEADVLKALQTKFSGLENKIKELENTAKAKTEAEINALLDAQPKGAFTDDERNKLKEIGVKAGVDALAVALKKNTKPTPVIASMIRDAKGDAAVTKDWKWYQKNDPKGLEKLAESNADEFNRLYLAEYGVNPA